MSELAEGAIVTGEVVSIKPFGAFVKLETGATGLIHISQLSDQFVEKVEDVLEMGATIKAKVLSVDSTGRISLSMKALNSDRPARPRGPKGGTDRRGNRKSGPGDFEDMMKKWMKNSEERLSALVAKQRKNR